jgi:hypothetical protein
VIEINTDMDQIRRRFVRGVLKGLEAEQLHAFVTSGEQTAKDES